MSEANCLLCRENLLAAPDEPRLVAERPVGRVLLQNDEAFRGYCILVARRHVTEITQLEVDERRAFFDCANEVAAAIEAECSPGKLNYAILGNEVPHLHLHVIPRYPDDGWWGKAIWLRPAAEKRSLTPTAFEALRSALTKRLVRP